MNATQKEHEVSEREFEDYLTETYGDVKICGISYASGYALHQLDEVAFRCGKSEYESSLDEDNPIWVCDKCNTEFDNENDAEECCKEDETKDE